MKLSAIFITFFAVAAAQTFLLEEIGAPGLTDFVEIDPSIIYTSISNNDDNIATTTTSLTATATATGTSDSSSSQSTTIPSEAIIGASVAGGVVALGAVAFIGLYKSGMLSKTVPMVENAFETGQGTTNPLYQPDGQTMTNPLRQ